MYHNSDFVPISFFAGLTTSYLTLGCSIFEGDTNDNLIKLKKINSYLIDVQKIAENKELDDMHILNLNDKFQSIDLIDQKLVQKNWKLSMIHDMEKLGWKDAEALIRETVNEDL